MNFRRNSTKYITKGIFRSLPEGIPKGILGGFFWENPRKKKFAKNFLVKFSEAILSRLQELEEFPEEFLELFRGIFREILGRMFEKNPREIP